MKFRFMMLISFCVLSVSGCGGGGSSSGGGGSSSQSTTQSTKAVLKLSTAVASAPASSLLSGVGISIRFPAGVTLATTSGAVDSGVVAISGVAVPGSIAPPVYTAGNQGTLTFVVSSATNGFGIGEFATVNCMVASGSTLSAADFAVTDFQPADVSLKPASGLKAVVTIQ